MTENTITPTKKQRAKSNVGDDLKLKSIRSLIDLGKEKDKAKEIYDEVVSRIRIARKGWKEKGVDLEAVDTVMRVRKMDDPEEIIREMKTSIEYLNIAKATAVPIGPLGLFEDYEAADVTPDAKQEDAGWAADEAGFLAAAANQTREDNVFEMGSMEYDRWDAGFVRGMEEKAAKVEGAGPVKPPARVRRDRKKPKLLN